MSDENRDYWREDIYRGMRHEVAKGYAVSSAAAAGAYIGARVLASRVPGGSALLSAVTPGTAAKAAVMAGTITGSERVAKSLQLAGMMDDLGKTDSPDKRHDPRSVKIVTHGIYPLLKAGELASGYWAGRGLVNLGTKAASMLGPSARTLAPRIAPALGPIGLGIAAAVTAHGAYKGYKETGTLSGAARGALGIPQQKSSAFESANSKFESKKAAPLATGEVREFERDRRTPSGKVVHEKVRAHKRQPKR